MKNYLFLVFALFLVLAISGCETVQKSSREVAPLPELQNPDETVTKGVTYQGVLNMLNTAVIVESMEGNYTNSTESSCNHVCANAGKTCVHAETEYMFDGNWLFHPLKCNTNTISHLICWCAMPPQ